MSDRPILMSAPMIRALLREIETPGTGKTQTRRTLKPQPKPDTNFGGCSWRFTFGYKTTKADPPYTEATRPHPSGGREIVIAPRRVPCRPGDLLWVREAWRTLHKLDCLAPRHLADDRSKITYEADPEHRNPLWAFGKLRPGIFLPRWASRLTLEVTEVRVERLQAMEGQHPNESDALAEGIHAIHHGDGEYYYSAFRDEPHPKNWCDPTDAFKELWESINGAGSWEANPWVCAITFRPHLANIDKLSSCDCCGKPAELSNVTAYGIETSACDQCRGME